MENENSEINKTEQKLDFTKVEKIIEENNFPKYRIKQFQTAFFKNFKKDFDEINELPKNLKDILKDQVELNILTLIKENPSQDSIKAAFKTLDNHVIESVLIRAENRITLCVSSQVGCPAKCAFCATGQMGFKRNLSAAEIISQYLYFARQLKQKNQSITNIVYMGMGEPMLNYDNVINSIEILTSPDKIGLGARNITISTVGIIPQLKKLLAEKHQFRIAISLHAPNQTKREQIVPITKTNTFQELISLTKQYCKESNKRITYEYILIKDLNDNEEDAEELASYFSELRHLTFINLIMYNPVPHANFERTSKNKAYRFLEILKENGIPAFIRFSEGEEINGACGQLAAQM